MTGWQVLRVPDQIIGHDRFHHFFFLGKIIYIIAWQISFFAAFELWQITALQFFTIFANVYASWQVTAWQLFSAIYWPWQVTAWQLFQGHQKFNYDVWQDDRFFQSPTNLWTMTGWQVFACPTPIYWPWQVPPFGFIVQNYIYIYILEHDRFCFLQCLNYGRSQHYSL